MSPAYRVTIYLKDANGQLRSHSDEFDNPAAVGARADMLISGPYREVDEQAKLIRYYPLHMVQGVEVELLGDA